MAEELVRLYPEKGIMLTIGVFDGVHLGHKYLLSELKALAGQHGLLSGVVTFRQHPQSVLLPQTITPCLTTLAEKIDLLKAEDVDEVIVLSFTRELAETSARQFIGLLQVKLGMQGLVIGPDFALGKDREGNVGTLRSLGQDLGFMVTAVPPLIIDGGVVSSTAIRNALAAGDMKRANNMMGRRFSMSGLVVPGVRRGVELGFPTANVAIGPEQVLPLDGVYATWVYVDGMVYKAMTNIGKNPTFGDNQRTVEVHLLDYQGDLYGRELKIDFMERLRGERQFETAEELSKQIAEDLKQGRTILTQRSDK